MNNLDIEGHVKTIDTKVVTKDLIEKEKVEFKKVKSKLILETSKLYKSNSIDSLLKETDSSKIKNKFGFKEWFSDYPNLVTPTFDFNPYEVYGKLDKISGFFDYYYNHSDTVLFVPNINIEKNLYGIGPDGRPEITGTRKLIKLNDYKKLVNEVHETLNFKNKKPIFVPFPLKFDIDDVGELAKYYIEKEFFNVWVDFQSSSTTNRPKLSLIRHLARVFMNEERFDDLILYSTNMRREIVSNPKDDYTPSSDVLTSIIGSNLVGVNREPPKPGADIGRKLTYQQKVELWKHKARVFEPKSYYYVKVEKSKYKKAEKDELRNKKHNITHNARLLNQELVSQKDKFLEEMSIKSYITNKPMVKKYRNGALSKILFYEGIKKDSDITDWF